jgi:o-succinylbenzoate synthase
MLNANFEKRNLVFKAPAGTSRGVLHEKPSWLLTIWNTDDSSTVGRGECSIIPGLSYDNAEGIDGKLKWLMDQINSIGSIPWDGLVEWPSIRFGLETAMLDLSHGGKMAVYPSSFLSGEIGIPINGLIWMGDSDYMSQQIEKKIEEGYNCLKMKIGAIGFDHELAILKSIRKRFSPTDLQLRVDANGAFDANDVWQKLDDLSALSIHSIEQPIKPQQWELMRRLCAETPIPIALDEELIGVFDEALMVELVRTISPQYLILKPGILGGFTVSDKWIAIAQSNGLGWWATSALEGNIGLNAIAQWAYSKNVVMPQGLGTGQLFTNNIPSPLQIRNGHLYYNPNAAWDFK